MQIDAIRVRNFKLSRLGKRVGAIIEDPVYGRDMDALSRNDIPAVQAVGKALLALGAEVKTEFVKQIIGRWVRQIMSAKGWTPSKSGRVAPGNLFSTGMIYRPKK